MSDIKWNMNGVMVCLKNKSGWSILNGLQFVHVFNSYAIYRSEFVTSNIA